MKRRSPIHFAVLVVTATVAGCVSPDRVTLESTTSDARLEARFPTVTFAPMGRAGLDFVLTDLTLDELDPSTDVETLTGRIVRISVVVRPLPGATPIDPTAANATVQYLILSRGAIGLYSGGAFVNPGEPLGTDNLHVRIKRGAMRLTARNDRFIDPLGPTELAADFTAVPDEALTARAAAKLEQILARLYRAEPARDAAPPPEPEPAPGPAP
ncbi:MAG: hypothetical protein ACF8R7_15660 [Phycisphaerales bacterium JB039]